MPSVNATGLIKYALRFDLTMLTTIFGSQPSTDVAADYVRSRAVDRITAELEKSGQNKTRARQLAEERVAEETQMTDDERDEEPIQVTVFNRDEIGVYMKDFHIKGFLNEAGNVLDIKVPGKTVATRSGKTDLKTNVWVFPIDEEHKRAIYFTRGGEIVTEPDEIVSRPKRVRNPRTGIEQSTISASEVLHPNTDESSDPLRLSFIVAVLKSSGIKPEQLQELFAYGAFMGLSQWRTGGHGRFQADYTNWDPSSIKLDAFIKAMAGA